MTLSVRGHASRKFFEKLHIAMAILEFFNNTKTNFRLIIF